MNAKMPALKAAFESAGFSNVRTLLSSGNVVFDTALTQERQIEQQAEAAMQQALRCSFYTIVRAVDDLQRLLAGDPYTAHGIPAEAKRVVTFMREPRAPRLALPLAQDYSSVFLLDGREVYSAYVPTGKGPVFMVLIERAFGKDVTTRTWDTVAKCAKA
jgi:uncharacterized protein (DUF1697 family)